MTLADTYEESRTANTSLAKVAVITSQTHLWSLKHWFSASTFVVKIATFAKPETVSDNVIKPHKKMLKHQKA